MEKLLDFRARLAFESALHFIDGFTFVPCKVPANTDNLIDALLTNRDFAVAPLGESSMTIFF